MMAAMAEKKVTELEFHVKSSGQWLLFRFYPFEEGVSIYFNDITKRKQIEQELLEKEEVFRMLIKNAFDIVSIYNSEGSIIYCSESITQVLGYRPEERIGKNIFDEPLVHPLDGFLQKTMFEKSLQSPGEKVVGEFRLKHKDGSWRIMECICVNQLADQRVRGIITNHRDVTERKQLEKQKEEFIAVASHELKTPVTSIKLYAAILQDELLKNNDQKSARLAEKMNTQVDRFINLLKGLLDFTRISEGLLQLNETEFDINELIEDTIEELQPITASDTILKDLMPASPIRGDKNRINQVLSNLLKNAIKYSPASDKVIVHSVNTGKTVIVSVEDFGPGISEEEQQKIFDRFFRASKTSLNHASGLGLGLYICSEIIKRHHGKIWVYCKKTKGCIFNFELTFVQ